MNLKEQYNNFYINKENENIDDTTSLVQFLNLIDTRVDHLSKALELGVGLKSSLFASNLNQKIKEISLLDFSEIAAEALREKYQTSVYQLEVGVEDLGIEYFDLILDAHCFHCITDKEKRKFAFKSVYDALKNDGIFCGQMMIGKSDNQFSGQRYIPRAHELEKQILENGFSLEYFMIVSDLHYELQDKTQVELVRFIARK